MPLIQWEPREMDNIDCSHSAGVNQQVRQHRWRSQIGDVMGQDPSSDSRKVLTHNINYPRSAEMVPDLLSYASTLCLVLFPTSAVPCVCMHQELSVHYDKGHLPSLLSIHEIRKVPGNGLAIPQGVRQAGDCTKLDKLHLHHPSKSLCRP